MLSNKKIIYIADNLFSKKNFFFPKNLKRNFKVIYNEFKRPLKDEDLRKIFTKYPNIKGIIAGLEKYNYKTISNQKNLKAISRVGVGVDSLDLPYLKKKNIKVIKLKDELTNSVSELFLTLILISLRNILPNINLMKKKKWKPIIGNNLEKKKIGILGFGKIGQDLHRKLKNFGCDTFVFEKRNIKSNKLKRCGLNEIFSKCDIVCISLSLNDKTKNLINSKTLETANKNITIINASRGAIINERNLYNFLKKNKNSKAFLDCYVKEPYKGNLLNLNNVFPLPHIASYTHETRKDMEYSASKNLIKYLISIDK